MPTKKKNSVKSENPEPVPTKEKTKKPKKICPTCGQVIRPLSAKQRAALEEKANRFNDRIQEIDDQLEKDTELREEIEAMEENEDV